MRKLFVICFILLCLAGCNVRNSGPDEGLSKDSSEAVDHYFVSENEAKVIAESFLGSLDKLRSSEQEGIDLLGSDLTFNGKEEAKSISSDIPSYYVYQLDKGGFIIVSASKVAKRVLGYSLKNNFSKDNANMMSYLQFLKSEINHARFSDYSPSLEQQLNAGDEIPGKGKVIIDPMIKTKWDQDHYTGGALPNGTAIGCLAIATGQIMKFWEYPDRAVGKYSYHDGSLGYIEHDYNYPIDWSAMPLVNTEKNPMLAKFFFGLAMSMNMNFGASSGAVMMDVPEALYSHYFYPSNLEVVIRGPQEKVDEWAIKIKNELDAGRPVLYGGQGEAGGHAFVADGYTDTGYFHINWGWGGVSDGWFVLDALNPEILGVGGGAGGFNTNQHYMKNFQPPLYIQGEDTNEVDEDAIEVPEEIYYSPVYGFSQLTGYIQNVKVNSKEIISGPSRYSDFSNQLIKGERGQKMKVHVVPSFTSAPKDYYLMGWLDIDNDGYFADYEQILKYSGREAFSGDFDIPQVISDGSHRMRLMLSFDGYPSAQKSFMNGEVEDYCVTVF